MSARSTIDVPVATAAQKARAKRVYTALEKAWPDATCALTWRKPHELLIATILSAQATDIGVNAATPALFKRFKTPEAFAKVEPQDVEPLISSIGLFRSKAKSIVESTRRMMEVYDGQVPNTMQELITLRGVARKTANVVLGNAFGINEGVVVDTHVMRLAWRYNLTDHEGKPDRIEGDLMARFPKEKWTMLSHLLVYQGRYACKARNVTCPANTVCSRYGKCGRCTCAD
ncbi:MAG TPA: endonuclease III [Phycisphaerales bacterium]|nr:endonuclease III [Phycisphaerales bacterium]